MAVGHISGAMGNNHVFGFSTLIIMKSKGNLINFNINGSNRIPSTVHGNVRSTGGGIVGMTLEKAAVPRRVANGFNTNRILLVPTPGNANIVTNNPIHTIIRAMNVNSVHAGTVESGGPCGIIHTAVGNLSRLHATRRITTVHNGSIGGVLNWKKYGRNEYWGRACGGLGQLRRESSYRNALSQSSRGERYCNSTKWQSGGKRSRGSLPSYSNQEDVEKNTSGRVA